MSVRERILTILLMNKITEEPRYGASLGIEAVMTAVGLQQKEHTNNHA